MTLPGEDAHKAISIPQRDRSLVHVLKEVIALQNERKAIYSALHLDPNTDTLDDALATISALLDHLARSS